MRVERLPWALRLGLVEEEVEARLAEARQLEAAQKNAVRCGRDDCSVRCNRQTEPDGCVELRD